MATRNKGEFDRNPAAPGGLGASDQRAMEDLRAGIQARASDEDVEREREKLRDTAVDGGGSVGAAQDGRAASQPEGEGEARRSPRGTSDEEDDRRRMSDAIRNEQDRLTRR